jgi:hypothetical protein
MNSKNLSPDDKRVTNPMLRKIHNVAVVQSRKGWTKEQALEAVKAAARGEVY